MLLSLSLLAGELTAAQAQTAVSDSGMSASFTLKVIKEFFRESQNKEGNRL